MIKSYEMANLTRKDSGQPFDIWVDSAGEGRKAGHSCIRVKAKNNGETVTAGFDKDGNYTNFKTPKDVLKRFGKAKELEKYLTEIKIIIELHWEGKITDREFLNIAYYIKKGYSVLDAIDKAVKEV